MNKCDDDQPISFSAWLSLSCATRILKKVLIYAFLIAVAFTMIVPFLWMLSTSLKSSAEVAEAAWFPKTLRWSNFVEAWNAAPFGRYYLNSLFVAICVTAGQVSTSALAGYSFARIKFPGRDRIFMGYLATMMIPGAVTMIPVFIMVRVLGWVDTYWGLVIPCIFTAYGTFMLRQFFMSTPDSLEEAARIDGCGYFRIFWHVALPLAKPALATLTIFTFMGNWGSFMWPLVVTYSNKMKTLPMGLMVFQGAYVAELNLLMAGSLIVMLPVIIVFLINQKHFVEGIKMSGFGGV